jgi:hypothetical protein
MGRQVLSLRLMLRSLVLRITPDDGAPSMPMTCSSRIGPLWLPRHSITSSAWASSVGGISSPMRLAVLRLITNSNFVDWITGRSAGLAPLRMRPA